MNKIILIIVIGFFLQIHAQGINWQSFEEDTRNIFSLNAGLEYGTSYNITYQRKTQVFSNHPIIPGIDLTIPFGRKLFDDWKIRINGLTPIWQNEKLSFDVNPGFIVRRYKTGAARIYNLGLDVSLLFGYYHPKWNVAVAVNYDKALFTHINHDYIETFYPEVKDGWYSSTGGNFKFGLIGSYSINQAWSVFLTVGKMFGENFINYPTIPFFAFISIQYKHE